MSARPEHVAPPEIFYNDTEAKKYARNTRMMEIQVRAAAELPAPLHCPLSSGGTNALIVCVQRDARRRPPELDAHLQLPSAPVAPAPGNASAVHAARCMRRGCDGTIRAFAYPHRRNVCTALAWVRAWAATGAGCGGVWRRRRDGRLTRRRRCGAMRQERLTERALELLALPDDGVPKVRECAQHPIAAAPRFCAAPPPSHPVRADARRSSC